jgi:hypothetical protein
MRRWISLIALLCLALFPACAGAIELAYQWPKAAELSGTNVNLRSAPSTGAPQVGRFADPTDAGELLVTAESKDEAGNLWYRVIGARHGEGWVFGKFVKTLPDDGPVASVCRRVRADYGVTATLMRTKHGEPERTDARTFTIREFNVTVNETRCFWSGHEAVFWTTGSMKERLRLLRVSKEGADFGGVSVGMTTGELKEILGAPEESQPDLWIYTDGRVDSLSFGIAKGRIASMEYARALFE